MKRRCEEAEAKPAPGPTPEAWNQLHGDARRLVVLWGFQEVRKVEVELKMVL